MIHSLSNHIKLTLRIKVLISLVLFIIVFLGVLIVVSQKMILVSFLELENKEAVKSIERTKIVFDKQIENMDTKLSDWAIWDDSYAFIQDKNQDYIDSNLTNESLHNLGINAMFFVSSNGAMLYEKQINIETRQNTPISKDLRITLLNSKNIVSFTSIKDKNSGVIRDSKGLVLFAARPILKSNATGPIMGALIFIRYYDEEIKEYLEQVNNNNEVDILNHDPDLPERYTKAHKELDSGKKYYAYPLSSDVVAGFTSISDFNNETVYILENELPRSIYKQGIATVEKFLFMIIILCLSGVVLVLVLLDKFVVSKIVKLNNDLGSVNNPDNSKNKLEVRGNDEFANVASNVNKMLDDIAKSEESLKKSDDELREGKVSLDEKVAELERMNKLMIGRELKMIELKKETEKLKSEQIPK
jgi:sensor domain CHASE-containing protein